MTLRSSLAAVICFGLLAAGIHLWVQQPTPESEPVSEVVQSQGDEPASIAAALQKVAVRWEAEAGVGSATASPLLVWVAIAPTILVDTGYEGELEEEAARHIPIRLVLLNDSYHDIVFAGSADEPLWHITVNGDTNRSGWGVMRDWIGGVASEEFGPGERRDLTLPWDGRDFDGRLLPPGAYLLRLNMAGPDGRLMFAEVRFEIKELN